MNFNDLIGKTLTAIEGRENDVNMYLVFDDDTIVHMHHYQDCCEIVEINDITGDLSDLIGSPLLMAEEATSNDPIDGEEYDSFTWTFYKFATVKGYVTIRWLGTSNGYYSEEVDSYTLSPTEVALFKMGYRYGGDYWKKHEGESFAQYHLCSCVWEGQKSPFGQKHKQEIEFRDEEQFISEVVDAECAHFYP